MILLHRITPFLIALGVAAGYAGAIYLPIHPFISLSAGLFITALLFARLGRFRVKDFDFWNLIGMPLAFLISGFGIFLFLESVEMRLVLAGVSVLLVFLFAESLFLFWHLPTKYQAYSIEHLTLVLNVLTIFFLSATGFGLRIFLQVPLYIMAPIIFLFSLFVVHGTVWACKVHTKQAIFFGLAGALLVTELYAVSIFLPIGFYANAAMISVFFYVFLGISRAHFLDKLSKIVLRRYITIAIFVSLSILGTTKWT